MSTTLDQLVLELRQFEAIQKAASWWLLQVIRSDDDPREYASAVTLYEAAERGSALSAFAYVGANEAQRQLAGEARPTGRTKAHRCAKCGLSPAESDHRGTWTFPFSRMCPSCSVVAAPRKSKRH